MRKIALATLVFLATPLLAQMIPTPAPVWITVAVESNSFAASAPISYRYGTPGGPAPEGIPACTTAGGCWDTAVTSTGPVAFEVSTATFAGVDPAPYIGKVLQILQTRDVQTISVNGNPLAVPALAPPPTTIPVPAGQVYSVALSIVPPETALRSGWIGTPPEVAPGAGWIGVYALPYDGSNRGYEGSVLNLNIDGVTLVCTYVSGIDGVFTLSCTVPAAP